jgi:hypothetical protein
MVTIQIITQLEDKTMFKKIRDIIFFYIVIILFFLLSINAFAADPSLIVITKGAWQKVATNVTTGQIHIKNNSPDSYFQTYRVTGQPAPTALDEGVYMPWGAIQTISSAAGIDVYIYCKGNDGRIRIDL